MRTLEIKDGVVRNIIAILPGHRAYYERAACCSLIDVEDYWPAEIGDEYDAETGAFTRNGAPLGAEMMRHARNQMLAATDYTQVLDFPCRDAERDAWRAYRQALRDLPAQPGWPETVSWPAPPSNERGAEAASMQDIIDDMLGGDGHE